jgi:hypothetical protein
MAEWIIAVFMASVILFILAMNADVLVPFCKDVVKHLAMRTAPEPEKPKGKPKNDGFPPPSTGGSIK